MQDTEEAQKALKDAKLAEEVKHAKWTEAEKAGQEADKYSAEKHAKVEEVLEGKITELGHKGVRHLRFVGSDMEIDSARSYPLTSITTA